jgi:hypothetical protein
MRGHRLHNLGVQQNMGRRKADINPHNILRAIYLDPIICGGTPGSSDSNLRVFSSLRLDAKNMHHLTAK